MRAFVTCVVALGLIAMPVIAREGEAGDKNTTAANTSNDAAANSKASSASTADSKADSPAKAEASSMELEIDQLRDLVESQAKALQEQELKMAALESKLNAKSAAGESISASPAPMANITPVATANSAIATAAAAPGAVGPAPQAAQAPPDFGKRLDGLEQRLNNMGPFSLAGDFRLRDEPFFGGPANQSQVRDRERFRLRVDFNVKLNSDISGGVRLTSGDANSPLTGNQTLTQFYVKKPINIDKAFIVYTPHQFKPLTLTGGKFAYPFYRTELVWDNDLNPEGLAQKLEWKSEKWTFLKQFALVGFELPFAEVAGAPATNKSIHQSVVYGGQIQTLLAPTSWLRVTLDSAFYNYHNPNPIALALLQASSSNPQTPVVGLLPLAGPSLQNSVTRITQNTIVTADVGNPPVLTALPTGISTITSAQFASKFALSDTIAQFDIKTRSAAWPVRFLADYVQNTRACANVANLPTVAPANTSTATFTLTSSAPCNSRYRRGNWLEARFGRQQEKGDWQFAYTHMLIEREAVMGAFNFDDMRQNTNVLQNRVEVFYNWQKNVQLGFTGLIGRPLASTEPYLKRFQLDVVYKF